MLPTSRFPALKKYPPSRALDRDSWSLQLATSKRLTVTVASIAVTRAGSRKRSRRALARAPRREPGSPEAWYWSSSLPSRTRRTASSPAIVLTLNSDPAHLRGSIPGPRKAS